MKSEQMESCPHCGSETAHTSIIEKHTKHVFFNGESSVLADMEIVRGGKRFYCNGCNRNVTALVGQHPLGVSHERRTADNQRPVNNGLQAVIC